MNSGHHGRTILVVFLCFAGLAFIVGMCAGQQIINAMVDFRAIEFIVSVTKTAKPLKQMEYLLRGGHKSEAGDHDGAMQDFNMAVRIDPRNSMAYCFRGLALHRHGDLEKAITEYTFAIKFNPMFSNAYGNRGQAKFQLGRFEEALEDYNAALNIEPNAIDYYNRGTVLIDLKMYDRAIADFTSAIQMIPEYSKAYHNRAEAKKANGDMAGAREDFLKVKTLEDDR